MKRNRLKPSAVVSVNHLSGPSTAKFGVLFVGSEKSAPNVLFTPASGSAGDLSSSAARAVFDSPVWKHLPKYLFTCGHGLVGLNLGEADPSRFATATPSELAKRMCGWQALHELSLHQHGFGPSLDGPTSCADGISEPIERGKVHRGPSLDRWAETFRIDFGTSATSVNSAAAVESMAAIAQTSGGILIFDDQRDSPDSREPGSGESRSVGAGLGAKHLRSVGRWIGRLLGRTNDGLAKKQLDRMCFHDLLTIERSPTDAPTWHDQTPPSDGLLLVAYQCSPTDGQVEAEMAFGESLPEFEAAKIASGDRFARRQRTIRSPTLWDCLLDQKFYPEVEATIDHDPAVIGRDLWRAVFDSLGGVAGASRTLPVLQADRLHRLVQDLSKRWLPGPAQPCVIELHQDCHRLAQSWPQIHSRSVEAVAKRRSNGEFQAVCWQWTAKEWVGLMLERLLSMPEESERSDTADSGFSAAVVAIGDACRLLSRHWRQIVGEETLSMRFQGRSRERCLYELAERIANINNIEIWFDDHSAVQGCLIETKRRTVIHLDERLSPARRAWTVFHELAHLYLRHLPVSSFGCDPSRLSGEAIRFFDEQETFADLYADAWIHLLDGLLDALDLNLDQNSDYLYRIRRERAQLAEGDASAAAEVGDRVSVAEEFDSVLDESEGPARLPMSIPPPFVRPMEPSPTKPPSFRSRSRR